ncbi:MAG TPA: hemerythrin domain-containing protein [Acidimicrobiales bacterium]|jgi:iron-sulfur cluster repair protein YtfE (RIC family)|nr:hemerythrin domain-containing protein [Acidimicrobiales bacterium]
MDVLDQLTHEHRDAEELLTQLVKGEPGDARDAALTELGDILALHMEVEERDAYPLVKEFLGADEFRASQHDHDAARALLATAIEVAAGTTEFAIAITRLQAELQNHVHHEESEVFPQLRQRADAQITALGDPAQLEARAARRLSK